MNHLSQEIYIAMLALQSIETYIDSKAIIAGGAPRDWFFDNNCNDIDIYVSTTRSSTEVINLLREIYKCEFSILGKEKTIADTVEQKMDKDNPYLDMPGLMYVVSFEVCGKEVQVINIAPEYRYKFISDFDTSICRVWIKKFRFKDGVLDKSCIERGAGFSETLDTGIITYRDDLKNSKHLSKMKTRFRDYQFFSDKEYKLLKCAAKKLSFRNLSHLHREYSERFLR